MLWRPTRLQWSEDNRFVAFLSENQGCWTLATQASGDDPPVWIDFENLGVENCDEWSEANDSLTNLLVTFCLQELTFGARFGVWDERLTKLFRSGEASITPLWLNGAYVHDSDCKFRFYLMDNDVLVGDFGAGYDSYFFAANSDAGIARMKAAESPIAELRLSLPSNWDLTIRADGSGDVGVSMAVDSRAEFPPGTIDFVATRDALLRGRSESGGARPTPFVFFMRAGRGYARGEHLPDWDLAIQTFERAVAAATNKQPQFDACCRSLPLGHAD